MSKKHSTKKALLMSVLSLLLCFSMLIGTTFAWFTDTVTSANNIIQSGNLDVELYYQAEGQSGWTKVTETTNIFKNSLWEPGHTEVIKLKVVNEGSLALKYQLGVNIVSETGSTNVNNQKFKLSEHIKYGIANEDLAYNNRNEAIAAVNANATSLKQAFSSVSTKLEAKNDTNTDEKIVTMVVYMPTSVGNEANYKKDAAVPTINLGINVLATQEMAEEDSFNNEYDKDSTYPVNMNVTKPIDTNSIDNNGKTTEEIEIVYDDDSSAISDVEVTVPVGTQLEPDTTELVLKIEEKDDVHSGVAAQITSEQTATTYEISLEGVADSNTQEIEVILFIEKGLVDVKLYHDNTLIPCTYDAVTGKLTFATTGFSPFTVVSATKLFDEGTGSKENPYIIKDAADLLNISKYYHEYKYYKVADGVDTLDLNGIGGISLYGSFDGNGVKLVNLTTCLFQVVGKPDAPQEIKISNMDVTVHTTNGRALVKNIFNGGETIFENVAMHGYIEGQYHVASFYNYGTANADDIGADYTVSFVNATSDVTLVCTTGEAIGGMLGHGYEGSANQLSINMDEKSGYTGKMYSVGAATCYQIMSMCSHMNYLLNGVETSRYDLKYDSTKLTVVAPKLDADGYYVAPVEGVDHYGIFLNAQLTAYDQNGNNITNLSGITGNLGKETITSGFDGKIFDLISSATIVNDADHKYGYELNNGALTIYTGVEDNYDSGRVMLQVNQYDKEGNLLAAGTTTIYTIAEPVARIGSEWFTSIEDAIAAAQADDVIILLKDIALPNDWTPACNGTRNGSSYTGEAFAATLDGAGHTISNVKKALFGVLVGTVKNVNLKAAINDTADSVGAVANVLVGGTVSNVTVSGTVVGPEAVGGIAGRVLADGKIDSCVNKANVTSTGSSDAAGGIVGKAYYTITGKEMNITNCVNSGTISGKYAVGGIVGFSAANVIGCTNSGKIILTEGAATSAGGIIGEQTNYGEVTGNTNTATITVSTGTSNVGGIIGWLRYQNSAANYPANETVVISGNVNKGAMAGAYTAGGIVGLAYNQAIVTGNTNEATTISAGVFAGGIVGGLQVDTNNLTLNEAVRFVVTGNTTTTVVSAISANCKDAIAYNNGPSDPTFANISNNTAPNA